MRALLRVIKELFRARKSPGQPASDACPKAYPGAEPDWTSEDMMALRTFLASPTGAGLLARGRAVQYDTANRACADVFHTQHACGVAVGFGQCLDWIDKLSRAARANAESGPDNEGHTDTQPLGEAVLREAMSP